MTRKPERVFLSASSVASQGKRCLMKAGPLARVSPTSAALIFLTLTFLCFGLSIYLMMLVKGVPDLDAKTSKDGFQREHPQYHEGRQRLSAPFTNDSTPYYSMPGTRFAKACKGNLSLGLIIISHMAMFLCVRNMSYCSPRSSRVYFTMPNIFTVLHLVSLWWNTISAACCANLIIEARVCGEDYSTRIEMNVIAVPVLILSTVFSVLTAPIHLAIWAIGHIS